VPSVLLHLVVLVVLVVLASSTVVAGLLSLLFTSTSTVTVPVTEVLLVPVWGYEHYSHY
jgi:hypothetical protein